MNFIGHYVAGPLQKASEDGIGKVTCATLRMREWETSVSATVWAAGSTSSPTAKGTGSLVLNFRLLIPEVQSPPWKSAFQFMELDPGVGSGYGTNAAKGD